MRSFVVSDTSTLLNNPRLFSLEGENVAELESQNAWRVLLIDSANKWEQQRNLKGSEVIVFKEWQKEGKERGEKHKSGFGKEKGRRRWSKLSMVKDAGWSDPRVHALYGAGRSIECFEGRFLQAKDTSAECVRIQGAKVCVAQVPSLTSSNSTFKAAFQAEIWGVAPHLYGWLVSSAHTYTPLALTTFATHLHCSLVCEYIDFCLFIYYILVSIISWTVSFINLVWIYICIFFPSFLWCYIQWELDSWICRIECGNRVDRHLPIFATVSFSFLFSSPLSFWQGFKRFQWCTDFCWTILLCVDIKNIMGLWTKNPCLLVPLFCSFIYFLVKSVNLFWFM